MRLLVFTNCPLDPTLGSGKTVLRWSEGLRRRGHEVEIVTPDDFVLECGVRRGRVWRMALGAWWQGPRRWRAFPADIVEFYGGEFGWLVQRLRRQRTRLLLIAHLNGLDGLCRELVHPDAPKLGQGPPGWRELDARCFANVDRVAALCQADADYVIRRGWQHPARCAVIESGLEPEFLAPAAQPPREHLVVYTGSWSARKDPATVVGVMLALLREDPRLRFEIMGASSDAAAIYAAFPEPVRARVLVHGKLPNDAMVAVLRRARVFFFPSLYEGYGMALAEAMACGCPSVTTPTGLGSSVRAGEEAWICPFRDEAAMQNGLRQLLRDDEAWAKFSQNGRRRVLDLTWARQGLILAETYERWLAERLGQPRPPKMAG